MKKLIVGCGYLGHRVALQWKEDGDTVIAVTRSPDRARAFEAEGLQPLLADVTVPADWLQLPAVDRAVYCVGWDRNARAEKRTVFVDGLANVLQHADTQQTQWTYVSSSSVYGQTNGEWVDETSECLPATENGIICRDAEAMFRKFCPTGTILRLTGIYGPGRLLARREQLMQGTPLGGNPLAWLNLIHVEDAAAAVVAIDQSDRQGELYLACDDEPVRRSDFYSALARLLDLPQPRFVAQVEAGRTVGLNKRCRAAKLKAETGWQPRYANYRSGLPAAIASDESSI